MDYKYFMKEALALAKTAMAAGEFPVGCVIVNDNKVIASGFRTGTVHEDSINEIDHAEMLALRQLSGLKMDGDPDKTALFCTMEPCLMCFGATFLAGIHTIVYAYEDVMGGGTNVDFSRLSPFYKDIQITIIPHILRTESLRLFQKYFSNPENIYWEGSLLEQYTLNQK
ncbi:MAG: nucleoside deaminase [Desulfobacterales bacterium]|nr:nucleoside deaminase [Desulfobacterales bacterium]